MKITSHFDNQAVTVGATAGLLVGARSVRRAVVVRNNDSTNTVYLGQTASVTSSNGLPLKPGEALTVEGFNGDLYAIASGASTDVRVVEFH